MAQNTAVRSFSEIPAGEKTRKKSSSPDNKCTKWIRKYFLEGQKIDEKHAAKLESDGAPWWEKHRRLIAFAIPAVLVHICWWSVVGSKNLFFLFTEQSNGIPRYYMSITMLFGSLIAGATSEGGASVAFPIMTLVFGIKPTIAVDFSFMIQTVGMTAAAFTILFMRVQVELHAIKFCTLGGIAGIIFGLEVIDPLLTPPYQKMYFVVIWFAFAFSLFWLNRTLDRKVYTVIPDMQKWKSGVLILTGFIGGIFSSIAGSGIDICSFATLTLLFRVTEKTATPTSVVLMAINTTVGFAWRQFGMGGVEPESWRFWAVCIPIVVLGAPMGSVLGSHVHRLVLASFVYVTDTAQLIGALVVVRPWEYGNKPGKRTPLILSVTSLAIVVTGFIVFFSMTRAGLEMMNGIEARAEANADRAGGDDDEDVELKVVEVSDGSENGAPRVEVGVMTTGAAAIPRHQNDI